MGGGLSRARNMFFLNCLWQHISLFDALFLTLLRLEEQNIFHFFMILQGSFFTGTVMITSTQSTYIAHRYVPHTNYRVFERCVPKSKRHFSAATGDTKMFLHSFESPVFAIYLLKFLDF